MPENRNGDKVHIWLDAEVKAAFDREAEQKQTNKTVLLNEILAERYGLDFEPSPASARRRTPFGGGPK